MAASDWIKVRTVLPTDGRLRIASRKCHVLPVTVFGALVTLWCLADSHASESGELVGYTCADVDDLVGVPGFCEALPSDWIDTSGEFVKLPNYQEHNGTTGKTRAQDAKRQKRHRGVPEVSRSDRDEKRTRGEEIREEKEDTPPQSGRASPVALHTFLDDCKAKGEQAIPDDDPIFAYADKVGLPRDFLLLAWRWFKDAMDGKRKKDWRAHFRNAVKGNWPRYWLPTDDGGWRLSPAGEQARRAAE